MICIKFATMWYDDIKNKISWQTGDALLKKTLRYISMLDIRLDLDKVY